MKVLQINAVYGYGSTGLIAKDIGDMLAREGHEAYFAYQSANEKPERGFEIGNKIDWKWHALYTRIFGKQAYASKLSTKKLLRWMDEIQPDVVHLHNLHSNYINLNMLCDYLSKKDIPTVITMHDCWYFTGKCTHYVTSGCNAWQNSCGNCPQLKKEVPSWLFDNTGAVLKDKVAHLNKIPRLTLVGCSHWIAGESAKSLLKPIYTDVVYNGVDVSVFTPHESDVKSTLGLSDDDFVILGMANKWATEENRATVEKIIDALSDDSKIVIVGCSDEQKQKLSSYKNVTTVGYVKDRKYLSDLYARADVFVNLPHADTLPTVNMESICSGTPVVTFDSTGSPELIDSDSGIVVRENDADGVIAAIRAVKTGSISLDVGEKQRKFDKNTNYNKYLTIYKNAKERE